MGSVEYVKERRSIKLKSFFERWSRKRDRFSVQGRCGQQTRMEPPPGEPRFGEFQRRIVRTHLFNWVDGRAAALVRLLQLKLCKPLKLSLLFTLPCLFLLLKGSTACETLDVPQQRTTEKTTS